MNGLQPVVLILSTYFRPKRFCQVCGNEDARTACGSSYCAECWENQAVEVDYEICNS